MNDREERQRAALEAALADSFDADTLAVYADRLLAAGDPRGELIAIDLEIERHGSTPALVARRTSLVHGWLGHHMPLDPHGAWIGDTLRLGFVEELRVDDYGALRPRDLPAVLASPIAPFIRAIAITATLQNVAVALRHLATRTHAHLQRLALSCTSGGGGDAPLELGDLVAATPRLRDLALRGNGVLARCEHPTVRTLHITGFDALVGAAPLVEHLDFALGDGRGWDEQQAILRLPDADTLAALLSPGAFPAVRSLDISRNEPEALSTNWYRGDEDPDDALDVFGWLASLPLRLQLRALRVPSVRSARDHGALADALATMPALEELVIARGHYQPVPPLPHARARVTQPPPWPWPRPSACVGQALRVVLANGALDVEVPVADAATVMVTAHDGLPAAPQAIWRALWQDVARGVPFAFDAKQLRIALDAVEIASWRELRMQLRERGPTDGEVVEIRHTTFDPW